MALTGMATDRDVRLDFVRGLAMLIIIIAHIPSNAWNDWIPARFGFSSAAEMFVFCSGMASALAFGRVFQRRGIWLGAARIAMRIWQLYWAQIAVFVLTVALSVVATQHLGTGDYVASLYLEWFIAKPAEAIPALLTLRYIPNFFDMLPMYMILLAFVPVAMMLRRFGRYAPLAASAALWVWVQISGYNLPARPHTDQLWFFNPLAWQFLFFIGFSFGMGWLRAPTFGKGVFLQVSVAVILVSIPLTFWGFHQAIPVLAEIHAWILPDPAPTQFSILRLVHFLALAYLASGLLRKWQGAIAWIPLLQPVIRVGQQTFAVFLVSVPLAWCMGMLLDVAGRAPLMLAVANLGGLVLAVLVAEVTAWFKGQPWREPRSKQTAAMQEVARVLHAPDFGKHMTPPAVTADPYVRK